MRNIDGETLEGWTTYFTNWSFFATMISLIFSILASYRDNVAEDVFDYKSLANWFNGIAQAMNSVTFLATITVINPLKWFDALNWDSWRDIYS